MLDWGLCSISIPHVFKLLLDDSTLISQMISSLMEQASILLELIVWMLFLHFH